METKFIVGTAFVCAFMLLSVAITIIRTCIEREVIKPPVLFWVLLSLSIVFSIGAGFGFHYLLRVQGDSCCYDYSNIIKVLSLLAAGVIAGFFKFTYQKASKKEKFLPTALSCCFIALFYIIFGSVCLFIGRDSGFQNTHVVTFVLPVIMSLILVGNFLFDFWDYITIIDKATYQPNSAVN